MKNGKKLVCIATNVWDHIILVIRAVNCNSQKLIQTTPKKEDITDKLYLFLLKYSVNEMPPN